MVCDIISSAGVSPVDVKTVVSYQSIVPVFFISRLVYIPFLVRCFFMERFQRESGEAITQICIRTVGGKLAKLCRGVNLSVNV